MKELIKKPLILPLTILFSIAIVILVVSQISTIEHQRQQYPVKAVEVVTVKKIPFRRRVVAYGTVEPAVSLVTRAEISGKISFIHPSLKKGESLAQGTLVLTIEPTTFEFSLDQSRAGLMSSQSSLEQLESEYQSLVRSLDLAKQNLKTGESELARLTSVWEKRLVSRSVVDVEEQKVLQLRQQVEELQGKIASYTGRRSALMAQIDQAKTQIAMSKDTLGRTEIRLPFDARIGKVSVEKGEYAAVGTELFELLGTQAVEVNAELPLNQFYPLIAGIEAASVDLTRPADLKAAISRLQLMSVVSLVGYGDPGAKWRGELSRIGESIDPNRDTINLVVTIKNPYKGLVPGRRPPLLKGMFVAVEFIGPIRMQIVLPRKAMHQGRVYIATPNNTLEIRPVSVNYTQGQLVTLSEGVEEGEKVIITDVVPVVNGISVSPILKKDSQDMLERDALGVKPDQSGFNPGGRAQSDSLSRSNHGMVAGLKK